MMRWRMLFAAGGLAALLSLSWADEPGSNPDDPPPRLMKKNKKPADDRQQPGREAKPPDEAKDPDEKKPDRLRVPGEEEPAQPDAGDEQEILERLQRDLRSAENRLANKEVGEGTQQVQRDCLKELDELIEKMQQDNQSSSDQSASNESQPKGGQSGKKRMQQAKGGKQSGGQKQTAKGQQPGQGNQQQPLDPQNNGGNTGGGGGNGPQGDGEKLADLYKDVWGHLPETLRAEMNAYASRQKFMPKYEDMLKQYYSTIAEKGRRKD
jgi:hypothetical protein